MAGPKHERNVLRDSKESCRRPPEPNVLRVSKGNFFKSSLWLPLLQNFLRVGEHLAEIEGEQEDAEEGLGQDPAGLKVEEHPRLAEKDGEVEQQLEGAPV